MGLGSGFQLQWKAVYAIAGGVGGRSGGVHVNDTLERGARGLKVLAEFDLHIGHCIQAMNALARRLAAILNKLFHLFQSKIEAFEMFDVNPG